MRNTPTPAEGRPLGARGPDDHRNCPREREQTRMSAGNAPKGTAN